MNLKKRNQFYHAKLRLKERYGISLNKIKYKKFENNIINNSVLLYKFSDNNHLKYDGKFYFVYDVKRKSIKTFLLKDQIIQRYNLKLDKIFKFKTRNFID